jgi:hypothetical protein
MMLLNELLQWAAIAFLGVFVLGLTRQLGAFLSSGREQQSVLQGPAVGRPIPEKLLEPAERAVVLEMLGERECDWAALVVLDENCPGCDQLVAHVERKGMPEGAPLIAICRSSTGTHRARLHEVADMVLVDPIRLKDAGIEATPFTILLDSGLRVIERGIGAYPDHLLLKWRDTHVLRDRTPAPTETISVVGAERNDFDPSA